MRHSERCFLGLGMALAASLAQAATFTVSSSADAGPGSLRQAMLDASQAAGADRIVFALPPSDPGFQPATAHWRIDVSSAALPFAGDLEIDGYSQPGAVPNTVPAGTGGSNAVLKIELRNTLASINGIETDPNNFDAVMVLRGLAIGGFFAQVQLNGGGAHRVEGCFLGTTIDGAAAAVPNSVRTGIRLQGPGPYRIGGLAAAARNLISGGGTGIAFFGLNSDGVRIQGNLIGSNAAGTAALSPRGTGIQAGELANLVIGGVESGAGNVISGNGLGGILLAGGSGSAQGFPGVRIQGNLIGSDASGTRSIGNGLNPLSPSQPQPGVRISRLQGCALAFGGEQPGAANLVRGNGSAGVAIESCVGAEVQHNRFIGNRGPAIELNAGGLGAGPTPNDPGDADEGGNRFQNFPELSLPPGFLPVGAGPVLLSYRVSSAAGNAAYPLRIEFHRAGCGGGGVAVLASDVYSAAEAQQPRPFLLEAFDGGSLLPLTAVAIDAAGNVSEFAPALGDELYRSDFEDVLAPLRPGRCD